MDACSPAWSWPQLPAHQEWLCCHSEKPTRLHGLCYRPAHCLVAHAPPASALNPSGRLHCPCPASAFDCLWGETNGNYFTEECRNMQRSKEQRKANRSQPKTPASKGKPQQAKAADAALAEFAGEASRIHSPSDLVTNHSWNPETGATCHITPHRQWLTHYRAHRVPVRLGDNSVV